MYDAIKQALGELHGDVLRAQLVIGAQLLICYLIGRTVFAVYARGRGGEHVRPFYHAAYVAVGAIAWTVLTFLALFTRIVPVRLAPAVALAPVAIALVLRWRRVLGVPTVGTIAFFGVFSAVFLPIGVELVKIHPQNWDEYTHWASRARQIYRLDRLPTGADPVACVAPHYGLFATLLVDTSYVAFGRESVGIGTAWSWIFGLLICMHVYEYLRHLRVGAAIAAIASTLLMIAFVGDPGLMMTSMYTDIHVAFGAMLAFLHTGDWLFATDPIVSRRENALLAACGFAIATFTKGTGDVMIVTIVAFYLLLVMVDAIGRRSARGALARVGGLIALALPAAIIHGVWTLYVRSADPGDGEYYMAARGPLLHAPRDLWAVVIRALLSGLYRLQPYRAFLVTMPIFWVMDVVLRRLRAVRPGDWYVSAMSLWYLVVLAAYVVVFNLTMGAGRARLDTHRYAAAILPVMAIYGVFIIDRLHRWALARDGVAPTEPIAA